MKKKKTKFKSPNIVVILLVMLSVLTLVNIYYRANNKTLLAGSVRFDVGNPGPGAMAPDFTLPSIKGEVVSLSDYLGETVLLYFQEGVMCQACWVQLQHIEDDLKKFENIGIDRIITITTDPLLPLAQKAHLERISSEVLSDASVQVSNTYTTNLYGMMGSNYNGHSFILVDENGKIVWRADYGGAPEYTMYVPIEVLISDIIKDRID
ncbi:MAG: peroxiredoxin family protein [Candidatus Izemoplasmataceae bacterium]